MTDEERANKEMVQSLREQAVALEQELHRLYGFKVTQPNVHLAAEALDLIVEALRKVAAEEREACAAFVADGANGTAGRDTCHDIADAIRRRGGPR